MNNTTEIYSKNISSHYDSYFDIWSKPWKIVSLILNPILTTMISFVVIKIDIYTQLEMSEAKRTILDRLTVVYFQFLIVFFGSKFKFMML